MSDKIKTLLDKLEAKIVDARRTAEVFRPQRATGKLPDTYWLGYWKGMARAYEEAKEMMEELP